MNLYSVAGVSCVITRFSGEAMNRVFGGQLVPYLASSHKTLLFRLYQHHHVRHNPAHQKDTGVFHVNLQPTLTAMRHGVYAVVCTNQRGLLSSFISKCSFCIIKGQAERLYAHHPEDPRALSLLGAHNVAFEIISVDLMSEVWVRHHSKSHGKPSHPVSILILCDLATGAVALTMASDSKSHSVIKCIKQISLRFPTPMVIITDKGSSLACLINAKELMSQLSQQDITIVPVGQGEQSSNFVERQVKETKKILNSLMEDSNSSTYHNSHTQEELQGKMYCVESILNARPIFSTTKSAQVQILTPKLLLSPYLSSSQYEAWLVDSLDPLVALASNAQLIKSNNNAVNSQLQESLLSYLQHEGLRYAVVQGGDSKPDLHGLKPMPDDVCFSKNSEGQIKFCIILEVKPQNMVIVKMLHNKIVTIVTKHIRNLKLLYRRSEWGEGGIPI